jgi:heme-degrading monooxygenase HmoA
VPVYTLGIWTVKPGREGDFVRAWVEMGERTKSDFPDATGTLLRDRSQPNRFISFGPWESLERVDQWRNSDAVKDGVGKMRELLDEFIPHTMDVAAAIV